jgi:hypothetical protein
VPYSFSTSLTASHIREPTSSHAARIISAGVLALLKGSGSSSNFGISIVGVKEKDLAPEAKTFKNLLIVLSALNIEKINK